MKKVAIYFFSLMIIVKSLLGCEEKPPIKSLPPTLTFMTYKPLGVLVSEREIGPGDLIYQRLRSVFEAERKGWITNISSYVTGPYVFRAEKLNITCYENMMLIDGLENSKSLKKNIPNLLATLGLPPRSPYKKDTKIFEQRK